MKKTVGASLGLLAFMSLALMLANSSKAAEAMCEGEMSRMATCTLETCVEQAQNG
jgi:hypothetical protein